MKTIIFLILNFGALGIGGFFTGKGVPSEWYSNLNKATWTPPGWFFGFAWTTIMICFSIYMGQLWELVKNKNFLLILFSFQWILNVAWNPVFFYFQQPAYALILIAVLTLLIGFQTFYYWPLLTFKSAWLLPYFIWLLVATSLNIYIVVKN